MIILINWNAIAISLNEWWRAFHLKVDIYLKVVNFLLISHYTSTKQRRDNISNEQLLSWSKVGDIYFPFYFVVLFCLVELCANIICMIYSLSSPSVYHLVKVCPTPCVGKKCPLKPIKVTSIRDDGFQKQCQG